MQNRNTANLQRRMRASSVLDTVNGIYRGWYIAGVSALSIGAVLGTAQFAFSLFILPLEEAFGWSRTQVNGALTCGVVAGLLSPYIGHPMDRFGARWTMAGSIALVASAFLAVSARRLQRAGPLS